jgi:hypothetical protein
VTLGRDAKITRTDAFRSGGGSWTEQVFLGRGTARCASKQLPPTFHLLLESANDVDRHSPQADLPAFLIYDAQPAVALLSCSLLQALVSYGGIGSTDSSNPVNHKPDACGYLPGKLQGRSRLIAARDNCHLTIKLGVSCRCKGGGANAHSLANFRQSLTTGGVL